MNTLEKDIKILARHVSKDAARKNLGSVHATPKLIEATDSYSLLQVIPKEPINVTDTKSEDYPDTKIIIENAKEDKDDDAIVVHFNINFMKALLLSFTELERNHGSQHGLHDIKMTVSRDHKPIVLEKTFHDETQALALLMPIKKNI